MASNKTRKNLLALRSRLLLKRMNELLYTEAHWRLAVSASL